MSRDLNKVHLIGRLGQDPELRYTQNDTAVANGSLATSSSYKNKQGEVIENTEWHRLVFWGRLGEIVDEYLSKGSKIYVEGKITTNKWEDKDGNDRYTKEIKVDELIMLGDGGNGDTPSKPSSNQQMDSDTELDEDFDDLDDDLPF